MTNPSPLSWVGGPDASPNPGYNHVHPGENSMVRMNIDEAARKLPELIERLERDGQSIELSRGDRVVARISPAQMPVTTAKQWTELFRSLPDLGDDREAFARDIESAKDTLLPDGDPSED